ncbi:calcium-binding protein [Marinivivus vitaminiproducens]|uniref:calcium-binding protein n=1 Tax=Marinivivus vitaminiproducens TaxID=3035935 RepID=UPI0027989157|nr:hypothetical protein P4R82_04960 [Geminicoccaceae bacterium SCSIO 64248]
MASTPSVDEFVVSRSVDGGARDGSEAPNGPVIVDLSGHSVPSQPPVVFGSSLTVNQVAAPSDADGIDDGTGSEEPASGRTLHGTDGDDVLIGTDGDDLLYGGPGNDVLDTGAGRNRAEGGAGDDRITGGAGDDVLYGDEGNDVLDGGGGSDLLVGGSGDDTLTINGPNDVALGGTIEDASGGGYDTLIVSERFGAAIEPTGGDPAAWTFVHSDRFGDALPDEANAERFTVHGTIDKVVLEGNADHDVVLGHGGQAVLGNDGDNRIWGGDGADDISGGGGSDHLAGGRGDDLYRVGLNDGAVDTIFDLEGANTLFIEGTEGQAIETALVGNDLHVFAGGQAVAIWSNYAGHESSLAGIDVGKGLVDAQSLHVVANDTAPQVASADLLGAYLTPDAAEDGAGDDWLSGSEDGTDAPAQGVSLAESSAPAWDASAPAGGEPLALDLLDHAQLAARPPVVLEAEDETLG